MQSERARRSTFEVFASLVEGLVSLALQYIPDREVNFLRALENGKQSFRFNRDLPGPLQLPKGREERFANRCSTSASA